MLKRSLLIGSMVAGAFLLPTLASAAVSGPCANCHTMHASQNGLATTANPTLLKGDSCIGCHAVAGEENGALGRNTTAGSALAPQVDWDGSTAGYLNNAGYFNNAADENTHHNVAGIDSNSDAKILANSATSPGGSFPVDDGGGAPALKCESCHSGSGGHHGAAASTYRILPGTNGTTSAQNDYGAAATAGANYGTRSEVAYDSSDMNLFCADCHGGFHQDATGPVGAGNQLSATAGTWVRHPTDIKVAGAGPSIDAGFAMDASNDIDMIVLGTRGADSDILMCITCHLPHGGPNADLLSFNYGGSGSFAGDNDASDGCETCHSYGGNGM
jgi:hypothetical protein